MSRLSSLMSRVCRLTVKAVESVDLTYTLTLMSRYVKVCRVCREYVENMSRYVETWLSDLLRTCHRHQVGTARPKARSDRRKCSGGSADGRVQSSVSELLQSAARCAKSSRVSKTFLSVKVVLYTQGFPGSHWGIPGGLGGAPSSCSSVPTAMDGADDISRVGIRVNRYKMS